jgi:glycosyltransferase involved in cell wall biosynthesis
MNINLDLQCVNIKGTGIAEFANMLIRYLQEKPDLRLHGYLSKLHQTAEETDFARFNFPIQIGRIPISVLNSRKLSHPLPLYYHWLAGNKADVNLYFTWNIKRVHYSGITIATIHDLIALRTEMENQTIVDEQRNDLSYTVNHCDYIITVSESSKKDIIQELNYPKDRIHVVPNGIDFEHFNKKISESKATEIRKKYHLPEKFILYLGGMRKHKNIERLIKAYSILPKELQDEYKLVITKGTDGLRKLVGELNLSDNIVFTAFIDDEDKVGMYQLASLYAYISLYEGFGIPVIEAQAAGTPVITSNTSSLPEVAGDSAVCVDPTSIEAIAEGIKDILTDDNLRSGLISKGYTNAKRYSCENAGENLFKFLISLKK